VPIASLVISWYLKNGVNAKRIFESVASWNLPSELVSNLPGADFSKNFLSHSKLGNLDDSP
jgi:hypothetical protein